MRPPGACPGLSKPCVTALDTGTPGPQNPVWAWVGLAAWPKVGQDWTGHPPTPLRFTPTAPGPRGVKAAEPLRISPRDLGNKKQAVPGCVGCASCVGWLVRSYCFFLIVKKGYQGEGRWGGVFRLAPARRAASNSSGLGGFSCGY